MKKQKEESIPNAIVENLLEELNKIDEESVNLIKRRRELVAKLQQADRESWDWISVKKACEMTGISTTKFYNIINEGKITAKHIGAKLLVKKSELASYDDRYSC